MLVVDESAAVRGAVRDFIQATTPYMVCDAVENGISAIQKAMESRCDLILLHTRVAKAESIEMASLLRSKLPHIKIVGFSSVDLENWEPPATGFDVVISKKDGLSKLVETLRALIPEPPRG